MIEQLYQVFRGYSLTGGNEADVVSRGFERLAAIPLRALTVADLDRYAWKAMTTWGTEQDFKHLLPRLLELALDDLTAVGFPEVLLGKLQLAGWQDWPRAERDAVSEYLVALWQRQLHTPGEFPEDDRIDTALGGLAAAGESLTPYLLHWESEADELPALHLAQLISAHADSIMTTGKVFLWGEPEAASQEIVAWLKSDAVLRMLQSHEAAVERVFPLVLAQLDGVRSASST